MEEIEVNTSHDFNNYSNLLMKASESTISMTKHYIDFIAHNLHAESHVLAIKENDRMLGAIPITLKRNSNFGNIINSGPYFGSYGGLVVNPDLTPLMKIEVKVRLLRFLDNFAIRNNCVLTMIDASPFDRDQIFYFQNMNFRFLDRRIAQITLIPNMNNIHSFSERFSSSCRRAIRKAEKEKLVTREVFSKSKELDEFYAIYKDNIISKGGSVRDKWFFEKAFEAFPKNTVSLQYILYNEKLIAGIFILYYKNIIQYTQPAIHHDYRHLAATNLLVYKGMEQGALKGYAYYNFGGTWESQNEVYNFKRSFGADDYAYYYFIKTYLDTSDLMKLSPEELEKEYPGFYVIPFRELNQGK